MSTHDDRDSTSHPTGPSALDAPLTQGSEARLPPQTPQKNPQKVGPTTGDTPLPTQLHVLMSFPTLTPHIPTPTTPYLGPPTPSLRDLSEVAYTHFLQAARHATGWCLISHENALHALAPALSYVHLPIRLPNTPDDPNGANGANSPNDPLSRHHPGELKRLDELTLPEALQVIRNLSDRLVDVVKAFHAAPQADSPAAPPPPA
jgi:hypothetical protein